MRLIRERFPAFVIKAIINQLPISFLLSVLEIFGLVVLLPVIQILMDTRLLSQPGILGDLYRWSNAPNEVTFVLILLIFIVVFFLVKAVIVYWATRVQTRLTFSIGSQLAEQRFRQHLYQPFLSHIRASTGDIQRQIIELPFNFVTGIFLPLIVFINEALLTIIILGWILWMNPVLVLCLFGFMSPFFFAYSAVYKKRLRKFSADRDKGQAEMFKKSKQVIEGFREIILFQRLDYFLPAFRDSVNRFSDSINHLALLNTIYPKAVELLAVLCIFVIFLIGVFLGLDMKMLAGFLATFALAAYRLIPSVNKMILSYNTIKAFDFVFDYAKANNTSAEIPESPAGTDDGTQLKFNEEVTVSRASFSFEADKEILHDVSLSIHRGDVVGIVGKSGSGKTTLSNILLGLFPLDHGSILIDGKVLDAATIRQWHRTVRLVPQNPILIEGTLLENIVFDHTANAVDVERLDKAIEFSRLSEFVAGLPLGLESKIGDGAMNISGGQKQRIAIARALYHNGRILIFDEPTSSLDRQTEREISDSIRKLAEEHYTIILITHKIDILSNCNKIYRLEKGKLSDPLDFKFLKSQDEFVLKTS